MARGEGTRQDEAEAPLQGGAASPPAAPLAPVPALRPPDPPPPPQTAPPRRRRWPWAVGLLLLAAAGGLLYLHPWAPGPTLVATEIAAPGPLTRVLAVNGSIAALNSVTVRSAVRGRLVALDAAVGDTVASGDVLARIDAAQPEAILRTAQAALDAGTLQRAQAEATLNRAVALGANAARNTVEDARRALQSAEQEIGRLTALTDQARIELDKYRVHAPIPGTILTRDVDPGQLVDDSATLFTLSDLTQLIVLTNVDETYATQIATGQPAVLQLVGETQTRPGQVIFVAPQVDVATGGLEVKIGFDTPPNAPVGLTVTANIIVDQKDTAISAPRAAIVTGAAGPSVFLVKDGLARRQAVAVTDWPADRLEVTSGLAAGDVVILDAAGLTDGQPVTAQVP